MSVIVAEYGLAFRMRVLACDVRPVVPPAGVAMVDFEAVLRAADVISVHVHLDDTTRGMIGASAFVRMPPGAILVNTSQGAIVGEAALPGTKPESRNVFLRESQQAVYIQENLMLERPAG